MQAVYGEPVVVRVRTTTTLEDAPRERHDGVEVDGVLPHLGGDAGISHQAYLIFWGEEDITWICSIGCEDVPG